MPDAHPIPGSTAKHILALATKALCDRPGESPDQAAAHTRAMVHTAMGFEPRDGLEYLLATLVYGHYTLILDSMRQVLHAPEGTDTARAKSGIAALERSLLAMVRELRLARRRPQAEDAPAPQPAEPPAEKPAKAPAGTFRDTLLGGAARTGPAATVHPFSTSQNTTDGPGKIPRNESLQADVWRNRPSGINGSVSNARI